MALLVCAVASPTAADGATPVRVEALVREAASPLTVEYGVVALDPSGFDDLADDILLTAARPGGGSIGPFRVSGDGDVRRTVVGYPTSGRWTVTIWLGGDRIGFVENLPWPHFSTEAGRPKIKVDDAHPERVGTLVALDESEAFSPRRAAKSGLALWAGALALPVLAAIAFTSIRRRRSVEVAGEPSGNGVRT